jgi:hypothetical protein
MTRVEEHVADSASSARSGHPEENVRPWRPGFEASMARPGPPTAPAPSGVVTGPDGQRAVFMTEEQYFQQATRESHALHLIVLCLCGGLVLAAAAVPGMAGGPIGMIVSSLMALLILAGNCVVNTFVGWLISKIFATDFGSFPLLVLHFAAVTAAYTVALVGLMVLAGPMFGILLSMPALVLICMWLIGMDLIQAFLYTTILGVVNWLLVTFLAAGLMSAVMA